MIEELKDYKRPWSDSMHYLHEQPLLEYIWEITQPIVPEDMDYITNYPCLFANRYFEKNLTLEELYDRHKELNYTKLSFEKYAEKKGNEKRMDDSFKEKFLNNEDLQNTIEAFGLDVSKFWYLLLFVYDYVESIGTNAPTPTKTLFEDFKEYLNCILKSTSIILKQDDKKIFETERNGLINLIKTANIHFAKSYVKIVNSELDRKEKIKQLKEIGLDGFIDNGLLSGVDFENTSSLDISHKKWKFAEMFLKFLKNKQAKTLPNKKVKVSKDKMMFISRLIYTVGYDTKRYNEEYDSEGNKNRMLSNLLRRYKNEKFPPTYSNIYF